VKQTQNRANRSWAARKHGATADSQWAMPAIACARTPQTPTMSLARVRSPAHAPLSHLHTHTHDTHECTRTHTRTRTHTASHCKTHAPTNLPVRAHALTRAHSNTQCHSLARSHGCARTGTSRAMDHVCRRAATAPPAARGTRRRAAATATVKRDPRRRRGGDREQELRRLHAAQAASNEKRDWSSARRDGRGAARVGGRGKMGTSDSGSLRAARGPRHASLPFSGLT
jgi:hypothetical protein